MKRIYLILSLVVIATTFTGCDKFLTRDPQDKQTNDTFWQSETSLRTYAQDFYSSFFRGYDADYSVFGRFSTGDDFNDDFIQGGGYIVFPVSNIQGYNGSDSQGWTSMYSAIYKANVMLEKIPDMTISDEAKKHWQGVGYMFRAMAYSQLLRVYGGCPYFDKVTNPADEETLYKDRDPYLTVAKNVLKDYDFAIKNMRADDGRQQVNKYVAAAYMSRDMLYHGTWIKYHENGSEADVKALLQGAVDGAKVVMAGPFAVGNEYNKHFCVDDLSTDKDVIFYREYTYGVQCNSVGIYGRREDARGGASEDAINAYLCSDGLPIGQSKVYTGGKYNEVTKGALENRDPRFYETFCDSLRIMAVTGVSYIDGQSSTGYCCRKFINDEWYAPGSPDSKFVSGTGQSPADAPVMRFSEVLLNYAEACYEMGTLSQTDLDNSINKIRARKIKRNGVELPCLPPMVLSGSSITANGVAIDDPARDKSVAPVLWEIRRERRVEMMQEGRRSEDLRRWAKYSYLNSEDAAGNPAMSFLGAYVNTTEGKYKGVKINFPVFDPEDPANPNSPKGYLLYGYQKGMRVFNSDKYYLKAIPVNEIVKYNDKGYKLTQNPGWEN